jgi:hypothetical protein
MTLLDQGIARAGEQIEAGDQIALGAHDVAEGEIEQILSPYGAQTSSAV